MPRFATGVVTELLAEREGLQRILVAIGAQAPQRAYVLSDVIGPVQVGDEVVLNTTAVDLGLGTGGYHVVHWNLSRREWHRPGPGHVMKLRYTSLQLDTGAAEEQSPDLPTQIAGTPVVACSLHSQLGVVAAAVATRRPGTRLAYVMTDGAALPLVLSDLVAQLRRQRLICGTVTAGNAFGGDLEAVSLPSALVQARHLLGAEVIVAGMGPGVVGTGSKLGSSAVEAASILDSTAALAGIPILCLRASEHDPRDRHRGVSHHSLTALELAQSRPVVAVPAGAAYGDELTSLCDLEAIEVTDPAEMLRSHDLEVTTMGRGPQQDPAFFMAAAVAGIAAVRRLQSAPERP